MNIPFFRLPHVNNPLESIGYYRGVRARVNWVFMWQRKGTSFGNLVIIGTYCWCRTWYSGSNFCKASLMIHPKWFTSKGKYKVVLSREGAVSST